jgi:hypothetical protein
MDAWYVCVHAVHAHRLVEAALQESLLCVCAALPVASSSSSSKSSKSTNQAECLQVSNSTSRVVQQQAEHHGQLANEMKQPDSYVAESTGVLCCTGCK